MRKLLVMTKSIKLDIEERFYPHHTDLFYRRRSYKSHFTIPRCLKLCHVLTSREIICETFNV